MPSWLLGVKVLGGMTTRRSVTPFPRCPKYPPFPPPLTNTTSVL